MEAQDPLSQLADIHLPDTVSWWPPAPGWWLLAVVLAFMLILALVAAFRRQRRQRALSNALQALDLAWQQYEQKTQQSPEQRDEAALALLQETHTLLKRVALRHFPAEQVAALNGRAWLSFLDEHSPDSHFLAMAESGVADSHYRQHWSGDPSPFHQEARRWISNCYRRQPDDFRLIHRFRQAQGGQA